ncbi:MAG: GrpB family protein [Usitatibacter sp.]
MSAVPDPLELSAYSPMWPAIFDIERDRLTAIFGADAVVIEHIGSTAVPGLGAKPIVDVMVGAPAISIVERQIASLEASGYRYVQEFEKSMPERRYFVKAQGHPGYFHLHGVVYGSPFWIRHLAFRDALRANDALAGEYWKLKRRLAARFPNDRGAYTDAKSEFIRSVIEANR